MANSALTDYTGEFLKSAWQKRAALLAAVEAGELPGEELPQDLLTTLLRHQVAHRLDDQQIIRETAFYLEAGADTSTQALTNSLDLIFGYAERDPAVLPMLAQDVYLIQRFVHEVVRLRPTVPRIRRRALTDVTIGTTVLPAGTIVELDTTAANRDTEFFGADADDFNPWREVHGTTPRYAHAFGGGVHSCIGRNLAVGLSSRFDGPAPEDHLFGIVPLMVRALLLRGIRPHPSAAAVPDMYSTRWTRWNGYPVVFG